MNRPLPGLWYEAARKRWRVRLYKNRHLYHLSYHADYHEALNTLHDARRKRPKAIMNTAPFADKPPTTRNLITGLRQSLNKR